MSVVVTTDVFCDGVDCTQWTHGVTNGSRTAKKLALREAKAAGWKVITRRQLCPACKRKEP